ncbi:RES family NAD+ phosphorylase (plasmid) [Rhizobium oryzihabitans]|uniref:RES family NAD+ phosphorylase n=1 Tax=Rhizobium oryzihabitans TaxID=2267833 RepID=A0A7L5BRI9_9HYPH|nr:RES family NAD+ phosphorylase [Rhizobium oryzihabitans]QIB41434.1 RES family NAD+ phosphorylase [Rhizobium oryzihabitans]
MVQIVPPAGFETSKLHLHVVVPGSLFGRIYLARYPDPLGFGKTPSRFSDPRRRKADNRFGVLYLGDTVKVCFLEAVLRDQRDGLIGDLPIAESELHDRQYAQIEVVEALKIVDLRDDGPIKMGVPTDVAKSSRQSLAREWAVAFHDHADRIDGIIYPSRLNGHTNLAVFDRSVGKLKTVGATRLIRAPGLASVLNDLNVAIVDP